MILDLERGLDLATALLPELILTVWAMLLLLITAWRHRQPGIQRQIGWLSLAGTIVAIAATIWLWKSNAQVAGLPSTMAVDSFRWAVTLIVLLGVALTTILSIGYLDRESINVPEYHVLVLLAAVGMLFMAGGADLLIIFLGLETMSVCVYVLAGINRHSPFSAEAALKYFLLGAFASAFLLYGIALIYGATGTTKLAFVGFAVARPVSGVHVMLGAGIAMLLVGFGFKVAAVPFHMWAPDVYDGSPTPATAFMAATVKAAAFGALVRVLLVGLVNAQPDWARVVWWLAAVTMVAGNLLALAQRSLKRMLAYSSVAHAGYLLAALVAGSVAGAAAFLFYLLFYTLATIAAFAVLIAKGRGGERDVTLDDLAGLAETHPLLAGVMAISMLSLMGFPGTAGFVGKWYILLAATGGGYVTVAVVLVLASVVSAGYYLPVIMAMYMKPRATERAHQQTVLPNVVRVMLAAMLVALVYFGVYPGSALETARLGSSTFLPRMMTAQSARPMQITPLPPGHPGTPGGDSPQLPPGHPGTPGATRQLPPGHPGVPVR
ncbi:MAG: NADH-quinone oxidoreductase subunit N [Gemmatimonadales bacterium]